jgi:hypothetical protein
MTTLLKNVRPSEWHQEMRNLARTSRAKIIVCQEVPGGGWHNDIRDDGKSGVIAFCPKCGKEGELGPIGHTVSGAAYATLTCRHAPCDFHDLVDPGKDEPQKTERLQ